MTTKIDADLTGRTCLVTGANTGIGKEVAGNLARMGARVILGCRSAERGQAALDEIAAATGSDALELRLVDLSSQSSIRRFAAEVLDAHEAIHVLVNNAAVWPDTRKVTDEGIELTFATNVLGYFLLTDLLLDRLKASGPARIVSVASELARDLDLDDLEFERRPFKGTLAYAQSKQANRMWSASLAERLEGSELTVNCLHPGFVSTELGRGHSGLYGLLVKAAFRLFGRRRDLGADTATWLASSDEVAGESGGFFIDRRKVKCRFHDDAAARATLWGKCEALIRPA